MRLRYLFFLALILGMFSCKKDNVDVQVNFRLTYDGAPLLMLKKYQYPDGKSIFFNRFSFFLSDVSLSGDGISKNSEGAEMLNFTNVNSSEATAPNGLSFTLKGVEQGTYTNFSFCVGVPVDLNAKKPSDFGNDSDLSTISEYWEPWKSFIFSRTEGFIDLDGDGTEEKGFALHTGGDAALICLDAADNFTVTEEENQIVINIDLKKLFGETKVYDIAANPQIHSLTQTPQVKELADNLAKAFSLVR